jgi:hypothetical protein
MVTLARRGAATVVIGLLVLAAGCSRDVTDQGSANPPASTAGPSTAAAAAPAAGTWTGTWIRTAPVAGNGTYTFVLQQQGQTITGTIEATGSSCLTKGPVSGTLSGTKLTLHAETPAISGGGQAIGDYDATLAANKITGNIKVTCSTGTGVGTMDLTKS